MKHRFLSAIPSLLLALCLCLCSCVRGEEITRETRGLTLSSGSVEYPVLLPEEDPVSERINALILEKGCIPDRLTRLAVLLSEGELKVSYEDRILEDFYSCVFSAEGNVETRRKSHVWNAVNADLTSGEEIPFGALFTDEASARETLENLLEEEIAPELSAHLQNSDLTPLPENFALMQTGLRLLYPIQSLSTLSDRAGDVVLGWNEIREVLDLSEGSVLARLGVPEMLELTESSAEKLRKTVAAGVLPDLPVKIGDPVKDATDKYRMLTDPDEYEGGRMFALEPGVFRNVYLLSDRLAYDWDNSRVLGIRMDRGCLYGLCVGQTEKETWRMILGEPDHTVVYDEERAEAERAVPGECDYYTLGDHQLRLLSDRDGILRVITLLE